MREGGQSRRPWLAVAALALVAALWAVVGSALFVPRLTDNGDEAVYLLQAESFRAGHLFPPAAEPTRAFLPWLSTTNGRHYVTKYTPVFPGFIAASRWMFGSERAALALAAAGAVVACYHLAREILRRRRDAVVAAAFLAGSPLFAIQSVTYLSYLFNAALLMGFAAALLAGVRRRSRPLLALGGLLLGLALFARPFDAVLFAAPLLGWWGWSGRHRVRRLVSDAGWIGLGAVPPLAGMAVYFHLATGSFFRPPFTFVGPSDTLGFGPKRMYAEMPFLDYTPGRALLAFGRLIVLTGFWGFGGLLLIGLAVMGYRSLRGGAGRWLALVAVTVPLGYLFFWGSFSSSEWGGPWRFGPFYWLPVIIPGSIVAAAGFARLWRWDPVVARFVAAGMAALSLFVTVRALGEHQRFGAERDRLYAAPLAAAADARPGRGLPSSAGRPLAAPAVLPGPQRHLRWSGGVGDRPGRPPEPRGRPPPLRPDPLPGRAGRHPTLPHPAPASGGRRRPARSATVMQCFETQCRRPGPEIAS